MAFLQDKFDDPEEKNVRQGRILPLLFGIDRLLAGDWLRLVGEEFTQPRGGLI